MEATILTPDSADQAAVPGPSRDLPAYLPWLDVLRFFACFLVIIQHSLHTDVGFLGHVGVALFFSISGFLIGRILAAKPDLPSFYARRFLRIYPAYLFTLVLYGLMAFTPLLHHPELGHLFWHNISYYLTFTFRLSPDSAVMPLVIVWSLCVEEVFYLLLPVLFLLRRKEYVAVALLLVVGILLVPRFYLLPNGAGTWFFFPLNLFLGVLLALAKPSRVRSPWFLAVALVAVSAMTANGITSWFHNFGLISAILCTAAVWSLATCQLRLPAILDPIRRMGMVSYGIYLLHTFCVPVAVRLFSRLESRPILYTVCVVLLTTAISVLIASLMKRFIEDPPLRLRPMLKLHPVLQYSLAAAQVSLIPTGIVLAIVARKVHW
jgi:peptidoglycan/LPS O-acetylase OafA/YrhL